MSRVVFKYDIEKDVDNFIRGLESINNPQPTKQHLEFFEIYGQDLDREKVRVFLKERAEKEKIDFNEKTQSIESDWNRIEKIFFTRAEEMFGITLPDPIIGYLSLNSRCTYNWRENYFFVSVYTSDPIRTVMHELLHFYTHRKYTSIIPEEKFNDIKEALTVLLNTDFKDLMGEFEDKGYPQHAELREKIVSLGKEDKKLDEVIQNLI